MGEHLIEDIILLRCSLVDEKISKSCIYQHVVGDINQQNTIFPFCFSEGETLLLHRSILQEPTVPEIFSFMLTDVNGTRKYAYCLRFPHFKEPECLCIIGKKPLAHLFEEILKIAKKLRLMSIKILFRFLDDICLHPIPLANEVLSNIHFHHLPYQIINSDELNDHSNHDVVILLKTFGASMLVDLVGYLLVERKFLFVSDSIQSLSETIMAFTSLIAPFQWQHVFIPVLPLSLVTYCAAPMPYVIGVKNNFLPNVFKDCGKMDDTIILNVDNGKLLNTIPLDFPLVFISNETSQLKATLTNILHHLDENSNSQIYQCFHKFFAGVFEGYNNYLKFDSQKQKGVFQMEEYEESLKQKSIDNYNILKSFQESQMCFMFFKEREEQFQQGIQIESICLLLKNYSEIKYSCETVGQLAKDGGIKLENQVYCKFCFEEIKKDQPCSFSEGRFYHLECFRCRCCGKLIIGDNCPETLKCNFCVKFNKKEMSDESLCELAKINFKQRNKLTKQEERMNLVDKLYKRDISRSDLSKTAATRPMARVSMRINRSETSKYIGDSPVLPETREYPPIIERASSPSNQQFIQHRPTATKQESSSSNSPDGRQRFLSGKRRSSAASPVNASSSGSNSPANTP